MINFKQRELSLMLYEKLKHRFPGLELVSITESPENPNSVWVNIIMPDDEDKEIEVRELASEISTDILMDYGYHILISSASAFEKSNA